MPPPDTATDVVRVIHPTTGELLDALEAQPPGVLADVLVALRERRSEIREQERIVEDELRRRLAGRERTSVTWGDYEVRVRPSYARKWDPDGLEQTLRELYDEGVIQAGEVTEVIHRETVVSSSEAQRLLGRLQGKAKRSVEGCFEWQLKGPPKVELTRIPTQLQPPEDADE